MKKRLSLFLALALALCAVCSPAAAEVTGKAAAQQLELKELNLYLRSDAGKRMVSVEGNTASIDDMDDDVYITPYIRLTNTGTDDVTILLTASFDGDWTDWDLTTIRPDSTQNYWLTKSNAAKYMTPGQHTVEWYANGVLITAWDFTITGGGQADTPAGADAGVSDMVNAIRERAITIGGSGEPAAKPLPDFVGASLWTVGGANQDTLEDQGENASISLVAGNVYLSPVLILRNTGSETIPLTVWCDYDGRKVTWSDDTLDPGQRIRYWLSAGNAETLVTVGSHTCVWYVNDEQIGSNSFTITGGASAAREGTLIGLAKDGAGYVLTVNGEKIPWEKGIGRVQSFFEQDGHSVSVYSDGGSFYVNTNNSQTPVYFMDELPVEKAYSAIDCWQDDAGNLRDVEIRLADIPQSMGTDALTERTRQICGVLERNLGAPEQVETVGDDYRSVYLPADADPGETMKELFPKGRFFRVHYPGLLLEVWSSEQDGSGSYWISAKISK